MNTLYNLSKRLLVIACLLGMGSVSAAVPNPTVTGPITCVTGVTCTQPDGLPEMSAMVLPYLAAAGYQEKEYFISGNATAYTTSAALTSDGLWNGITPNSSASYKTRILVRSPIDPEKFNGSVIVEWQNVTAGLDLDLVWSLTFPEILRGGYAYVDVSAQSVGVTELPVFDPLRYGSLSHPGDSYAYSIFSQATQAIRHPVGINPLAGLKVKRIIATGNSQSAAGLTTYIDAIQKLDKEFDGFLVSSRILNSSALPLSISPSLILAPYPLYLRTDIGVPLLVVEVETDYLDPNILRAPFLNFFYGGGMQPDSQLFHQWEVAGTSHLSNYELTHEGAPLAPNVVACVKPLNDGLAHHYVMNKAVHDLNLSIITGRPVLSQPRFSVQTATPPSDPIFFRDSFNNIKGGIRTPFVDVPIATYSGIGNINIPSRPDSFLGCYLAGSITPLDSGTIHTLYPNHFTYVIKVALDTLKNVLTGAILPEDADEIIDNAINSPIGN